MGTNRRPVLFNSWSIVWYDLLNTVNITYKFDCWWYFEIDMFHAYMRHKISLNPKQPAINIYVRGKYNFNKTGKDSKRT